jgi:uncharacterized protein YsxB (DUF464 family)
MLKVVYDGANGITMTGHAGQAPMGHDLVCAGASTLITALAEELKQNEDRMLVLKISLESGAAYVKAIPTTAYKEACEGAFSVALRGFEMLSAQYSDYILFERCI